MTWAKFDDGTDEELEYLGHAAHRLFVDSITMSRRRQLGGRLAPAQLSALLRRLHISSGAIPELLADGPEGDPLWTLEGDVHVIRNYEKFNPLTSTERVKKHRREKRAETFHAVPRNVPETVVEQNETPLTRASATGLETNRDVRVVPVPLPVPVSTVSSQTLDAEALSDQLGEILTGRGVKLTGTKAWPLEADRMLRLDKRDFAEAAELLAWATNHHFWAANILSMPTFRAKYDQLRLQRERELTQPSRPSSFQRRADQLLEEARP